MVLDASIVIAAAIAAMDSICILFIIVKVSPKKLLRFN